MGMKPAQEGKGYLYKNMYKTKDNHPDWKGMACVNGKQIEVAAWDNDGQYGPWLSLSVGFPREEKREQYAKPPQNVNHPSDTQATLIEEDDIPF